MSTLPSDDAALSRRGVLVRLGAGGAGLALAARGVSAAAQDATPMPGSVPDVVQQWFDAWNSSDPAANVAKFYTDDGVYEDVPSGQTAAGPDAIQEFLGAFLQGVSDVALELQNAFATETWAAAEYWFGATDQGFIPGAQGKAFRVRTVTVFELEGDLIRRSSDYFDVATIFGQLGVTPSSSATPSA